MVVEVVEVVELIIIYTTVNNTTFKAQRKLQGGSGCRKRRFWIDMPFCVLSNGI